MAFEVISSQEFESESELGVSSVVSSKPTRSCSLVANASNTVKWGLIRTLFFLSLFLIVAEILQSLMKALH